MEYHLQICRQLVYSIYPLHPHSCLFSIDPHGNYNQHGDLNEASSTADGGFDVKSDIDNYCNEDLDENEELTEIRSRSEKNSMAKFKDNIFKNLERFSLFGFEYKETEQISFFLTNQFNYLEDRKEYEDESSAITSLWKPIVQPTKESMMKPQLDWPVKEECDIDDAGFLNHGLCEDIAKTVETTQ